MTKFILTIDCDNAAFASNPTDDTHYNRDVEPHEAEACWDDAIRRAQDACAKARGEQ